MRADTSTSEFELFLSVEAKLIEGNGYETLCSIFLFTFFNRDPAQNKNIPAYIGQ